MRLKYQKIAEDIQERESKIVNSLKSKYNVEMTKQIDENRSRIALEYKYALDSQKNQVKQQMEKMVGQNSIIKKLCESAVTNENTIINTRFIFYKMTARDSFGKDLMPPTGQGFDILNKNLLHDCVDGLGNNILKQSRRMNLNIRTTLERAHE